MSWASGDLGLIFEHDCYIYWFILSRVMTDWNIYRDQSHWWKQEWWIQLSWLSNIRTSLILISSGVCWPSIMTSNMRSLKNCKLRKNVHMLLYQFWLKLTENTPNSFIVHDQLKFCFLLKRFDIPVKKLFLIHGEFTFAKKLKIAFEYWIYDLSWETYQETTFWTFAISYLLTFMVKNVKRNLGKVLW